MPQESPQSVSERKARVRDAARVLPFVGLFLLLPPVIALFAGQAAVAGVPLIVVYLFGVWGALVAGAALLARGLEPDDGDADGQGPVD